jgi:hypothetical protein
MKTETGIRGLVIRRGLLTGVTILALARTTGAQAIGDEYRVREPGRQPLQRMAPVGGWHPDRGGLLHSWNPRCVPHCGSLDDYCRKPLPQLCKPSYPPFYLPSTPEIVHP